MGELDLVAEFLLEETGERGGEADVASSASELDVHGQGRHCVLTGKGKAAAPARGLHPGQTRGAAREERQQRPAGCPRSLSPSQPSSLFLAV